MKIDRRDFLKGGTALSTMVLAGGPAFAAPGVPANAFAPRPGKWRNFEVTTRIEIQEPKGDTHIWMPVPAVAAEDWSRPLGSTFKSNGGKARMVTSGHYGAKLVTVRQPAGSEKPVLEVTSRYASRDRSVDLSKPRPHTKLNAEERKLFLTPTKYIPTDGIVKETAAKIVGDSKDDLTKARKIYEWIVVNTFRDAKTRGCGLGDIAYMLKSGNMGGKCADLNALMVGLARASGIPARDLYGIRVAPSQFGYKALGANAATITGSQHCRAEVYLSKFGWVPVDPADVRKVILEEPPGNLPITDAKVEAARATLFGSWEGNWMAYNDGHEIPLPGSKLPPIAFLMYPQAATGSGELDCLNADAFKYTITTKEITA